MWSCVPFVVLVWRRGGLVRGLRCGGAVRSRVSVRLSHGPVRGLWVVSPSASAHSILKQVVVRALASQVGAFAFGDGVCADFAGARVL